MPLDPVKIPQNVYVEDRVVGPLTLRQVLTMTVGGGISYVLYALLQKASVDARPDLFLTILAWTPCAISVLFSVVKINDLSLMRILFLTIERFNKAPTRTWGPRAGISINIRYAPPKEEPKKAAAEQDDPAEKRIRELSSIIDRPIGTFVNTAPEVLETRSSPLQSPAAANTSSQAPLDGIQAADTPAAPPPRPASKNDGPAGTGFSDLSVFRDVFTPKQS